MQEYGIDTSEIEGSLNDYRSLNEFFARRLRPEARPIDSPGYAPWLVDKENLSQPWASHYTEHIILNTSGQCAGLDAVIVCDHTVWLPFVAMLQGLVEGLLGCWLRYNRMWSILLLLPS